MNVLLRRAAIATVALALSTVALADRIYLANGTSLSDVTILNETLSGVQYRAKGKSGEQSAQADQVLRVEYEKMPRLVDEAEAEVADGNLETAAETFQQFADGALSGEAKVKEVWAPAYAAFRAIEVNQSIASADSLKRVASLADMLAAKLPDSRYVPLALIAKAGALRDLGKNKEAGEATAALRDLVASKVLSESFRLEADVLDVEIGTLKGQQRRDRLIEIQGQAGSQFPLVRNRARVLEAETYLEGENRDYGKARKIYESVIKDPKAADVTLAGAYTGMGDCLFQEAADKIRSNQDAAAILKEAVLSYLRVVEVYKAQSRYVPKSMFQAGRVFELMGEDQKDNARKMYGRLIALYPGSEWANQARSVRK